MNTFSLLYLEDDQALSQVTVRALQKRGFEVCHQSSLEAVMELARTHGLSTFSHALLDLRLEDGNSLSLIEQLLSVNPDIRIVILTGYASIATTVQAIKLGATNYLAKPATIEQILKAFNAEQASPDTNTEVDDQTLSLKRIEWEHIQQVLKENKGNISATARQLNMHRRTLQRKLNKKPSAE